MTTTTTGVLHASARLSAFALATALVACGGDGANDTIITYDNHLPMQVGDRWVYRERDTSRDVGTMTNIATATGLAAPAQQPRPR